MKDINVDKDAQCPADAASIKSIVSTTVLKQSIIVTTKWPPLTAENGEVENISVLEDRQGQLRDMLTPLLDSETGSVLRECQSGGEWNIVQELVARVDACSYVIYPESLKPLFASRFGRFLLKIKSICECRKVV